MSDIYIFIGCKFNPSSWYLFTSIISTNFYNIYMSDIYIFNPILYPKVFYSL